MSGRSEPPLFVFEKEFPKSFANGRYAGKYIPKLNPAHAFYYFQTFGFPFELWQEKVKEQIRNEKWFTYHYNRSVRIYEDKKKTT